MGGAYSNGQDNDELIDNLVDSGYIRSKTIEQVFRAVDRGDYVFSSHRENAYKDFAWKFGNIHLSAPCIYCEVMEKLCLKPGLSFLNLGSGTGYLNTMAGLLLSQNGINHGIEVHEDCVKYSYDRLEEFKQTSLALDEFDFCEPIFVQGNCLSILPGRRYDRVYCGATCPETHEAHVKEFVKVGGILVMPYKDHLLKIKRKSESEWETKTILPVSFANLLLPSSSDTICTLPVCDPLSLQELCRGKIRRRLRDKVWSEHEDLVARKPISTDRQRPSTPQRVRRFIIPIYNEDNNSDDVATSDEEPRLHRTQLLLNVDGPPGENLRTTLRFVRAVIQPYAEAAGEENADNDQNMDEDEDVDDDEEQHWPQDDSPSTEDEANFDVRFSNSERGRRDSESSSDSACEKSQSESCNDSNKLPIAGLSAYSNMSESESELESEAHAAPSSTSTLLSPTESSVKQAETSLSRGDKQKLKNRTRRNRNDAGDSGILEDVGSSGANEEPSLSSDSDFASGTPVKHKRSSSEAPRDQPNSKRGSLRRLDSGDGPYTGHYVDSNAFSSYMQEKIRQLPIPHSLKNYLNYNREFSSP